MAFDSKLALLLKNIYCFLLLAFKPLPVVFIQLSFVFFLTFCFAVFSAASAIYSFGLRVIRKIFFFRFFLSPSELPLVSDAGHYYAKRYPVIHVPA